MKNYTIAVITLIAIFVGSLIAVEPVEQTRLVVEKVMPNSPHERAGILPNDILIKYDGKNVSSFKELAAAKEQVTKDSLIVVFLRGEKEIKFKIAKGQSGVSVKEYLPDIKYKEDAVVIKNIPALGWDKMNSFIGSLELAANHLGIKRDYVWINGVSGAAFRLHFCEGWCPSSPDPTCGFNSAEEALKALGLEYKSYNLSSDGKNKPEILNAIKQSINNDRPVIAIDLLQVAEWGLITGYQNNGEELLCRTYFDRRQGYEIAEKFPFGVYVITASYPVKTSDNINNYKNSFKIVEQNLKTEMYDDYYSGLIAFDKWIEALNKTDFAALDTKKFEEYALANAWIFDRLVEDRTNAVIYLKRNQYEVWLSNFSKKMEELINLYEQEVAILTETKDLVIYPFNMKSQSDWTTEMRSKQIEVLKKAKTKEVAALKIWEELNKENK